MSERRLKVAIAGTGISGLAAAWLLSQRHDVTVYERADRIGGHANTVLAAIGESIVPVDTGFIVFNRKTYPNLSALFAHLGVPTAPSDMSFAYSLNGGDLEYSGGGLSGLFGQRSNAFRPHFWSMLKDLRRFYRQATRDAGHLADDSVSLGQYLDAGGYGESFRRYHILPMASAIWSATPAQILAFPAASFIRFYHNHGLLQLTGRPGWETVCGGSAAYVERLSQAFKDRVRLETQVVSVQRRPDGPAVYDSRGQLERYDHVVLATHADQALKALADPTPQERELLGAVRYSSNLAVLHTDAGLMPKRRSVWSSWNYLADSRTESAGVCVTYWMNKLQPLPTDTDVFVTLNPPRPPHAGTLLHSERYEHPVFDAKALAAQRRLWSLQGRQNVWFCGAHFGSGFHEDGLQAGLAVAEQIGGVRRPWTVAAESGRIVLNASPPSAPARERTS